MDLRDLHQFSWIVHGIGLIFLLWLAHKLLGLGPAKLLGNLIQEIKQLSARKFSVSALNALGCIVLFVFGVLILVLTHIESASRTLTDLIGTTHAETLVESADLGNLFLIEAILIILSIWVVGRTNR